MSESTKPSTPGTGTQDPSAPKTPPEPASLPKPEGDGGTSSDTTTPTKGPSTR